MPITIEEIDSFFQSFPYTIKKRPKIIDYDFYEGIIPKINSTKQEQSINPPALNIFDGFNLGENELKHCSVLSWFFNPAANHCQGALFLTLFLKKLKFHNIITEENRYFTISTEDNFTEYGRVDINIFGDNFWFIIEAKVSANEQDDQINRYQELLKKKSSIFNIPSDHCKLFFLTRDGRPPTSGSADYCISWKDISEVLESFATQCKNEYISLTARQYATYIKENI